LDAQSVAGDIPLDVNSFDSPDYMLNQFIRLDELDPNAGEGRLLPNPVPLR